MNEQPSTAMNQEDRLKAVLYQFITLYERWVEDRQMAAKQGADMAELIQLFNAQVKNFKALEFKVRQEIANTIYQSATAATKVMTEKISKLVTDEVDISTNRLHQAVERAIQQLNAHQRQVKGWYYWWMGSLFGLALAVGIWVARVEMPDPYLSLTGQELQTYENGQLLQAVWPQLSKEEKNHLMELAKDKNPVLSSLNEGSDDNPSI